MGLFPVASPCCDAVALRMATTLCDCSLGGQSLSQHSNSHWGLAMPSAPASLGVGLQCLLAPQSLGIPLRVPLTLCASVSSPLPSCPSHGTVCGEFFSWEFHFLQDSTWHHLKGSGEL